MKNLLDDPIYIRIALDGDSAERLQRLCDECHAAPDQVAASLLHDLLKDDEYYNVPAAMAVGDPTIN